MAPPLHSPPAAPNSPRHRAAPLRVAAAYLALGLLWVWLSDFAVMWLGVQSEGGLWVSVVKGTLFVCLSTALVYWLVRRDFEALSQTTALLRAVCDGTDDAVFVKDRHGKYLLLNEAASRFIGRPVREALGRDDTDLFDLDGARKVMERDRRVLATGRPETEEELLTAAGVTRTYLATKAPCRDERGLVIGVMGVSRDITDRKRAERALRESEYRLRLALAAAHLGVWEWDLRADTVLWSPECYQITAMARFAGRLADFTDLVHPDDRDRVITAAREAIAGRTAFSIEFRIVRPDGEVRWVANFALGDYSESGEPVRLVGTVQDITLKKGAEEELRQSEQRSRLAQEAGRVGIFDWDAVTGRSVWTEEQESIYGMPAGGFEGSYDDWLRRVHPEDRPRILDALARMVADRTQPPEIEYRIVRPDGEVRWVTNRGRTTYDEAGRLLRLIGTTVDITDRKVAEEALHESERRALTLADNLPDGALYLFQRSTDGRGRFLYFSEGIEQITGVSAAAAVADESTLFGKILPEHRDELAAAEHHSLVNLSPFDNVFRQRAADGQIKWLHCRAAPRRMPDGSTLWDGIVLDVTARKRTDEALLLQSQVLEQIARGAPLRRILAEVVRLVEDQVPEALCSILLLDRDGTRLLLGAARQLPAAYNDAIDGVHIGPNVGSCGTAAFRGETVVVADIATDPLWADYRDLALSHGLRACWSLPIFAGADASGPAGKGRVLGTFALYRHQPSAPTPAELEVVARAAHLAGVAIARDEAERAVRDSEDRYRRLVDVLPSAVFLNTGGKIVFCNPAFLRLVGANDPAQVRGKAPFDFFHPDYHDFIRSRAAHMLATGLPVPEAEEKIVRLDGRSVTVHVVATPISDSGADSILVAIHDLTERERSMGLLRSVLASVADAIVTIDEQGALISVNPATERLFGYTAAELVGQHVGALLPEPPRSWHDSPTGQGQNTELATFLGPCRDLSHRRKDGSTFPGELTVTEFWMGGERHFTAVIRDITERKKLEAQFRQAQKMEAVGRLAGGVAHDFNNLLTVINGYSDVLLADLPPDGEGREAVAAIREAGERASRLTQQLLAFGRKAIVESKLIDLNDLVAESVRLLRRLVGEDIVFTAVLDPALPRIKADPGQLEQVVMNLVVNARDAMPTGGHLTVETRAVDLAADDLTNYPDLRPGPHARLAVSDTGCGMSEVVKANIFEPFFTTKGVGKGSGLGLAVVHGVVKQWGGHINVDSGAGVGTTFMLLFPAAPEAPARPEAAPSSDDPPRGLETVLLVEDEPAVRSIVQIGLEMQGYTVLPAEDGPQAVRLATEHPGPIHLLITDVVMPGMGGRQVADEVRARRPDLQVLYMSGYTDDAVVRHGVMDATDAFLQKPFTPLGLARKVRAVLDGLP